MLHTDNDADAWTLIVFTRWPTPGKTKTRLIPAFGADGAADIHRQLLLRTLSAAKALPANVQVAMAVTDIPSDASTDEFVESSWQCVNQRGGDLGERMANAIDDAFALNPRSCAAILVGVDCPAYSTELFLQAAAALHRAHRLIGDRAADVVYAPTADGGYGLVGVSRDAFHGELREAMFSQIHWGSATVMQTSTQRIGAASGTTATRVKLLQTIWDVDTPDDVARAVAAGYLRLRN